MDAANIPQMQREAFANSRAIANRELSSKSVNYEKEGGVELLATESRRGVEHFLDQLEQFGIFIVRRGRLENWLSGLGGSRNRADWLTALLTDLGDDPAAESYVLPSPSDIWDFVRKVGRWIN